VYILLLFSVLGASPGAAAAPGGTAAVTDDLAMGIQQVDEGDLDTAIITLDAVANRLTGVGGREKELGKAHLYMAVAHLGLLQQERASQHMAQALRADPTLALNPREFSPRVVQLYEQTKTSLASETRPPQTQRSASDTAKSPGRDKRGGTKVVLGVLGGAAAIGGAVLAAGGGAAADQSSTTTTVPPSTLTMTGIWKSTIDPRNGLREVLQIVQTGQALSGTTYFENGSGGRPVPEGDSRFTGSISGLNVTYSISRNNGSGTFSFEGEVNASFTVLTSGLPGQSRTGTYLKQ
jgi:hypothetical protein